MEEFVQEVSELPLLFHPGKHWWYCIGFDIAGALIEKVSQLSGLLMGHHDLMKKGSLLLLAAARVAIHLPPPSFSFQCS